MTSPDHPGHHNSQGRGISSGYRRVRFTGTGIGLIGTWIKWWLLCLITLGIYSFWVAPRLTRWIVEHQNFG